MKRRRYSHNKSPVSLHGFGYVYVLRNPSMPGLLKIGRSVSGGAARAGALYQTGVAEPFDLVFEIYTNWHGLLEKEVHKALSGKRANSCREFFRVAEDDAIECILSIYLKSISSSDSRIVDGVLHDAAVDLLALSHTLEIPAADVFDCLPYLGKDAVECAVNARNSNRSGEMQAHGDFE